VIAKFAFTSWVAILPYPTDPMDCGSYRGIKLLEHAMKVVERIFEHGIQQQIVIGTCSLDS